MKNLLESTSSSTKDNLMARFAFPQNCCLIPIHYLYTNTNIRIPCISTKLQLVCYLSCDVLLQLHPGGKILQKKTGLTFSSWIPCRLWFHFFCQNNVLTSSTCCLESWWWKLESHPGQTWILNQFWSEETKQRSHCAAWWYIQDTCALAFRCFSTWLFNCEPFPKFSFPCMCFTMQPALVVFQRKWN